MKKFIIMAALVIAAAVSASAKEKVEVVARDTIEWKGDYIADTVVKRNDFGELKVTYRLTIIAAHDSITGKDKSKRVSISKDDWMALTAGEPLFLVYTTYEDGSERITKALAGGAF